jgi:glycosyltransferase involved in cell wall biosynthesis
MSPRVSIIVPSFNQGCYLSQALDSILDQNYPNLELIVIDGGSTDGSLEIIKARASGIHYWVSKPDGGHAQAILKGLAMATGEIMAWLNSDDFYFPWTLAVVSKLFQQFPAVDWITGRGTTGNSEGAVVREEHDRKNKFSFLIGDYGWIQQESTFWRRRLWDKAFPLIRSHACLSPMMIDSLVWCCFFRYTEVYNVNAVLACYRQHTVNRAEASPRLCVEETELFIAHLLFPLLGLRMRTLVSAYRLLRQLFSLFPVRILLNTTGLQGLAAYVFSPPPFSVISFCRHSDSWLEEQETFFFKPHRPHSLKQLSQHALVLISPLMRVFRLAHVLPTR